MVSKLLNHFSSKLSSFSESFQITLSVFKFAQDYFSRGLKFARFEIAHPKQKYSHGLKCLKFAHLSWIETTKIDKNRWIEAIFPQE